MPRRKNPKKNIDDEPLVDYGAPPREKCAPTRLFYEPEDERGRDDEDDDDDYDDDDEPRGRPRGHPEHCECPSCVANAVRGMFETFNEKILKPVMGEAIEALPTSEEWVEKTFSDADGENEYDFKVRRRPRGRPRSEDDDEEDGEPEEPVPEVDMRTDDFEFGRADDGVQDKPDMRERKKKKGEDKNG